MTPWKPDVAGESTDDQKDAGLVREIADFVVWFVASHYSSPSPAYEAERAQPRRGAHRDRSEASA